MKFSFVPILVCTYILLCFSALTEETRAINLFKEVRCLVCQGQTIHESNAEIAEDLKKLIREKIDEGETDKEIKGYLVEKYGDWILYDPGLNKNTYLLWLLPILIFLFGGAIIAKSFILKK